MGAKDGRHTLGCSAGQRGQKVNRMAKEKGAATCQTGTRENWHECGRRIQKSDTGQTSGAMVYASAVFLVRQALGHVSDRAAYQELLQFVGLLGLLR